MLSVLPESMLRLAYLAAAVLFIQGLRDMTHPRTAVRGNLISAAGMFVAVAVTVLWFELLSPVVLIAGLVVGGLVAAVGVRSGVSGRSLLAAGVGGGRVGLCIVVSLCGCVRGQRRGRARQDEHGQQRAGEFGELHRSLPPLVALARLDLNGASAKAGLTRF